MNLRRAAIVAWVLALAPAVPATFGAQAGATLDAQGWWNKTQALPVEGNPSGVDDPTGVGLTTAPTVPAPATVPAEGLYVANDASGAAAVAAVRYALDGQAGGTLTLRLAEGSALTGTEELVACPVLGGFEATQNGRWDAKPGYDETACTVEGVPTETNDSLTFAVPSSFGSALGDVAVIVVPKPGSTTPFSLSFAEPADGDFAISGPVASTTPTSSFSPSFTPGSPVFTAPGSSSFATPSAPSVPAPAGGEDQSAAPAVPVPSVPAAAAADPARGPQVAAIVTLLVIGAALWWLGSQPQRAPRLLGSVGGGSTVVAEPVTAAPGSRPRGVGRFARPRSAPPTPI